MCGVLMVSLSPECYTVKMRTLAIISIGSVLVGLWLALVALVYWYPYPDNFAAFPKVTHTASGAAGDPVDLLFVGSKAQIVRSFEQAGWLIPDPITRQTSERIAVASLTHRSYPTAPVSNLYLFGRVQDLAFEKPTTDVQYRGHLRIWKTPIFIDSQPIWLGAATYDSGIELSSTTHFPTHHIAPAVDLERNAVGADLETTRLVKSEALAPFTAPLLDAHNGGGDYYASDGDMLVINYTDVPLHLHQPGWLIEALKQGVFSIFDALLSELVLEIVVGTLLLTLIASWLWLALSRFARNRDPRRRKTP